MKPTKESVKDYYAKAPRREKVFALKLLEKIISQKSTERHKILGISRRKSDREED